MKAFDPNYKLLDEMYHDDYYPCLLYTSAFYGTTSASEARKRRWPKASPFTRMPPSGLAIKQESVSYTHLDVYKRQARASPVKELSGQFPIQLVQDERPQVRPLSGPNRIHHLPMPGEEWVTHLASFPSPAQAEGHPIVGIQCIDWQVRCV